MRKYQNLLEAAKEIERDLWEMGVVVKSEYTQSRFIGSEGNTKEVIVYSYSLPLFEVVGVFWDKKKLYELFKWIRTDEKYEDLENYLKAEFRDRIVGNVNSTSHKYRWWYWQQFQDNLGYTYGERLANKLAGIVNILKKAPYTRQAIVAIWHDHKDWNHIGIERVPCSMYYQFILRQRTGSQKLDMHYVMRSCDFYTHWLFDVVLAGLFASAVALKLEVNMGIFHHTIGSLHAYVKDLEKRGIF